VIDFRYHLVSLVAVFLALALGLFLGSTTLQSTVTHNLRKQADSVISRNHDLQSANDQANQQLKADQAFAAAVEPYAVASKLLDTTVVVVSAPGVEDSVRQQMLTTLGEAGAAVTADVRLQSGFLDSRQDSTWGQLAAQLSGSRPLPRTNGAGQAAAELARVLVNRPGAPVPAARRIQTVLSTFSSAKMLTVSGPAPVRPADLAVLLVPLGSAPDGSPQAVAQYHDLIALARVLRHDSSGVVAAGPTIGQSANGGPLAAMRADGTLAKIVSTVDSDDTAVGRVATVLALDAAPAGVVGRYGIAQSPPLPAQSPPP
jgi:hypothetical protein